MKHCFDTRIYAPTARAKAYLGGHPLGLAGESLGLHGVECSDDLADQTKIRYMRCSAARSILQTLTRLRGAGGRAPDMHEKFDA